jgi:hypothetical protein
MYKNELNMTMDIEACIEGRLQTVILSVEYTPHSRAPYYWLSALTETGFDLCNISYGYFKGSVNMLNTRLRSKKSITNDMLGVLDSLARSVQGIADGIILSERTVTGSINGTEIYLRGVEGVPFTSAANIQSVQSGQVLSWYAHDVFRQGTIELTAYRNAEGQLRFKADETMLYDTDKLRALVESEAFKSSKYAFFLYNECRRLLGMPVQGDPARMSGLMPSNVQE